MTSMIGLNAAAEINFGRTQMMQRELAAQQDFTVSEIFVCLCSAVNSCRARLS